MALTGRKLSDTLIMEVTDRKLGKSIKKWKCFSFESKTAVSK
jgi:hypothetical protein